MKQETKDQIYKKIRDQQRKAKEISKFLRSTADPKVSYIISTKIILQNDKFIPITEIEEIPKTRIGHNLAGTDNEQLVEVDFVNLES